MSESTEIANAIYYLASMLTRVGLLIYAGLLLLFLATILTRGRQ